MRRLVINSETLFRIGMQWRIAYGFCRIILAAILLDLIGWNSSDIFVALMRHEIIEDPNDFLFSLASSFFLHFSFTITYFLPAYLFFWGIVDIFLSTQVLRKKLWAFPISITLIILFVLYEIYRISHTHSLILGCIILIDIALIVLIGKEYRSLLSHSKYMTSARSEDALIAK